MADPETALAQGQAVLQALRPRGPDGEGMEAGHRWLLGHTRLAILDLSDQGRQPMRSPRGTLLTFNGEIYNFRELRGELEAEGHVFHSTSDTEVLLEAMNHWGLAALPRLRGMFAFGWLDPRDRTLILARDRFGVKPLCYRQWPDGLCFASDLHALRRFPSQPSGIDLVALRDYLALGYVPSPRSILGGGRKLRPGHHLVVRWTDSGVLLEPETAFFSLDRDVPEQPGSGPMNARDQLDAYADLVERAVDYRLISDVEVGTLMSGGIDSTLVTVVSGRLTGGRVASFTMGFDNPEIDESPFARAITDHLGLHNAILSMGDASPLLAQALLAYDEPFADESLLPTFALTRQVAKRVKVVLSGDGGDEVGVGYPWHRQMAGLDRWNLLPHPLRRLVGNWAPRVRPTCRGTAVTIAQPDRMAQWLAMRGWKDAANPARFPVTGWRDLPPIQEGYHWQRKVLEAVQDPLDWAGRLDLMLYLPDNLMVKIDRASMAHGLEVREPLLDHDLVLWMLSQPVRTRHDPRTGTSKTLSRRLLERDLPRALFERRKQGFTPDTSSLWTGALKPMLDQTIRALERGDLDPLVLPEPFSSWADYARHIGPSANSLLWRMACFRLWLDHHQTIIPHAPAISERTSRYPTPDTVSR
ncbi:MAG: asparagine synthase (glutamine-hydrolyzing) [Magnetococcales bacterium]|nr:asparagine synthase (glutamine-hydrolyzing) [Magnetococcales bacterium]